MINNERTIGMYKRILGKEVEFDDLQYLFIQ